MAVAKGALILVVVGFGVGSLIVSNMLEWLSQRLSSPPLHSPRSGAPGPPPNTPEVRTAILNPVATAARRRVGTPFPLASAAPAAAAATPVNGATIPSVAELSEELGARRGRHVPPCRRRQNLSGGRLPPLPISAGDSSVSRSPTRRVLRAESVRERALESNPGPTPVPPAAAEVPAASKGPLPPDPGGPVGAGAATATATEAPTAASATPRALPLPEFPPRDFKSDSAPEVVIVRVRCELHNGTQKYLSVVTMKQATVYSLKLEIARQGGPPWPFQQLFSVSPQQLEMHDACLISAYRIEDRALIRMVMRSASQGLSALDREIVEAKLAVENALWRQLASSTHNATRNLPTVADQNTIVFQLRAEMAALTELTKKQKAQLEKLESTVADSKSSAADALASSLASTSLNVLDDFPSRETLIKQYRTLMTGIRERLIDAMDNAFASRGELWPTEFHSEHVVAQIIIATYVQVLTCIQTRLHGALTTALLDSVWPATKPPADAVIDTTPLVSAAMVVFRRNDKHIDVASFVNPKLSAILDAVIQKSAGTSKHAEDHKVVVTVCRTLKNHDLERDLSHQQRALVADCRQILERFVEELVQFCWKASISAPQIWIGAADIKTFDGLVDNNIHTIHLSCQGKATAAGAETGKRCIPIRTICIPHLYCIQNGKQHVVYQGQVAVPP
jgi:hypothetical protein